MKYLIRFIMLFVLFAWVIPTFSQEDKNAEINKIKRNRDYLTVTGTSTVSAEEASENAKMLIDVEIEQWIQENAECLDIAGYIKTIKKNLTIIETKNGSLFRAFIYVKKKDILPFYEHETVIAELPDSIVVETPVVDTMKTVEVVIPLVDENIVKVESEENLVSTVEYLSSVEKPLEEVVVAPLESAIGGISNVGEERAMLRNYSVSSVSKYLGKLKRADRLSEYGKEVAWPGNGVVYFFFADYNNVVRGYIKVSDGNGINLANGEKVEIAEYLVKYESGTYIWFTLKQ